MNRFIYILSSICIFVLTLICFILPLTPFFSGEIEEVVFIQKDGVMIFPPIPPSTDFLLGTDDLGRDILHQIILYGQNTLGLVALIVVFRFIISLPISYLMKSKSGGIYWCMEKIHHYLSGLPILLFVILFMNLPVVAASDQRTIMVIMIIVVLEIGRLSYLFSDHLHSLYQQPFYEAAKMSGAGFLYRLKKYDLRHFGTSLSQLFVLELSRVMLLLGQLGFLSMFISQEWFTTDYGPIVVQNRFNTWPNMLADTRDYIQDEFWIPLVPVLAITFAIFTFQLSAEALKRYFSFENGKGI